MREVDYTTEIGPKPTRKSLDNIGNAGKYVSGEIEIEKWCWYQIKVWK